MRHGRGMKTRSQLFTRSGVGAEQEKENMVAAVGDAAVRVFQGLTWNPLLEIPGKRRGPKGKG